MEKIYDIFKKLHVGTPTEKSWEAFEKHAKGAGAHDDDATLLQWILESPHIKESMKEELIGKIAEHDDENETEIKILYSINRKGTPEEIQRGINSHAWNLYDSRITEHRRMALRAGLSAMGTIILTWILKTFADKISDSLGGMFLAMIFGLFALTAIFVVLSAIKFSASGSERCREDAEKFFYTPRGRELNERLGVLMNEQKELGKLNRVIAKYKTSEK